MSAAHSAATYPPRLIRVFIAEDHRITLWGLTRLIDSSKSMEVVGTACSRSALLSDKSAANATSSYWISTSQARTRLTRSAACASAARGASSSSPAATTSKSTAAR